MFVHVVLNTFLRINRCFIGVLGPLSPKGNAYHLIREALATGALGYVVKPRLASDLLASMGEALEGRSFVSSSV